MKIMEFFRRLFVDVKAIQARCINERSSSEGSQVAGFGGFREEKMKFTE